MVLDKDKKIKVQQKLIEQLTEENKNLREQLLFAQLNNTGEDKESLLVDLKNTKEKYDMLIKEVEQLRNEYRERYAFYHKLTDKTS